MRADPRASLPAFIYLEAPVGEDPDKRDYIVSNAKIEATGYLPASLDDGITELIKGFHMIRTAVYGKIAPPGALQPVGVIQHDLAAVIVGADRDVDEFLQPLTHPVARRFFHEEDHEAAAAGAK